VAVQERMMQYVWQFASEEAGAAATEYGLLLLLVALALVIGLNSLGTASSDALEGVATQVAAYF
jgi:Flp pilus assembly pilin Flp